MALVAGIDSSTQATKVEVRDVDTGKRWGQGREPHEVDGPTTGGRSEQDPGDWWRALIQAFHQAGRYTVAGLSVAGQQHGLVVLDERGEVLRPAKLWNDTESAPQAAALVERVERLGSGGGNGGTAAWAKAVGSVPTASFTITKLAWLAEHEPDVLDRTSTVLLPHDYLTWKLTGRLVTDRGDASGTGYWSPAEGRWRTDLLRLVDGGADWAERLPLVLSPTEPAGSVTTTAALPLGLDGRDTDVVVGPGTGDNMAAALGIGLRPGDVAMSLGTSGTVFAVAGHPTADATGAVAGFADAAGAFLPLVCTLNATRVTDTVARLLGGLDTERMAAAALAAPPGAGGLVLLPYLDGERTPNRHDATGLLTGLRTATTPEQLARAAFEGVVCGLLDGLDRLDAVGAAGPAPHAAGGRLFLVGGGARSAAYRRIVADLSQRQVTIPDPAAEHVAVGAAVQAAAVLTKTDPHTVAAAWSEAIAATTETVDPDPTVDAAAVRAAYAAVRDRAGGSGH